MKPVPFIDWQRYRNGWWVRVGPVVGCGNVLPVVAVRTFLAWALK
jgi:hypothetical protein